MEDIQDIISACRSKDLLLVFLAVELRAYWPNMAIRLNAHLNTLCVHSRSNDISTIMKMRRASSVAACKSISGHCLSMVHGALAGPARVKYLLGE